jgi:glycosyltransferase involved in cell wall biosynthesis
MSISVVIPLYNKEKYIATTISSVLQQSYSDYEIIVVDDGSSDQSVAIVKSFTDPRIVLVQQPNQGVSKARNTGVDTAKHPIVAFLDADDEWVDTFLETIVGLVTRYPEAGIYGISYFMRDARENRIVPYHNDLEPGWEGLIENYREYYYQKIAVHSSSFAVRKEAFYGVGGFNVGEIMSEDLLFVLKVLRKNKLAYKNVCGVYYNQGVAGQVTSCQFEYAKDCLLNGLRKILTNETAIPAEDKTIFQQVFDRRLRYLFQFNITNGNGIDRAYVSEFMTTKGRGYGFILWILSFLSPQWLLRLYQWFRKIKRSIRH